jgi:anti-sigma factor RsiW
MQIFSEERSASPRSGWEGDTSPRGGCEVKVCADRRETLLLDIHGELPASEQAAWQSHLETCPGCRQQRQELVSLLNAAKDAMPSPALSPEHAKALRESVTMGWRATPASGWWRDLFFGMSLRPVPALIAAGFLLVVIGWFGLQGLRSASHTLRGPEASKQVMVSDAEVIENLDLLEHIDDIERIVRVVDHRDIVL